MAAGSRKVAPEERVFSLVLALVASPYGLKRDELLSTVYGYEQQYRSGESHASLERQFERDKAQLREMGIPVETIEPLDSQGNTRESRYRIDEAAMRFPSELSFSADDIALLRLASLAWKEGSLTADARRASMKVEALGAGFDAKYLGVAPELGATEPSAAALQDAIERGRTVSLLYQLPERDVPLERHLAPLQLHRLDGRWHLIAWDLDRNDSRVFLLSRIVGRVSIKRVPMAEDLQSRRPEIISRVTAQMQHRLETTTAELEIRRGSPALANLLPRALAPGTDAKRPDRIRVTIGTLDLLELADELVEYGSDVVVLAPDPLAEAHRGKLRRILAAHERPHGAGQGVDSA